MNTTDIAKLAGVSRGTVSRVINNKPDVAEKTRKNIEKIIKDYGFTPNNSARNLVGKSNNIIELFVADLKSRDENNPWLAQKAPYFMSFITATIGEAKKFGYKVLVNIVTDQSEYKSLETDFKNKTISGGIFIGFDSGIEHLWDLAKKNYNLVFIDQFFFDEYKDKNIISLKIDDDEGGYKATKYLIKMGHKKILHIHGSKGRLSSSLRIEGYKRALEEFEIEFNKDYLVDGDYLESSAYRGMLDILENNKIENPTAVFAGNDIMGYGVIKAIREKGLKIPEDISVMGYDNDPLGKYLVPRLTTMEVPLERVSKFCIENLINQIDKKKNEKEKTFNVTLVERESVQKIY